MKRKKEKCLERRNKLTMKKKTVNKCVWKEINMCGKKKESVFKKKKKTRVDKLISKRLKSNMFWDRLNPGE